MDFTMSRGCPARGRQGMSRGVTHRIVKDSHDCTRIGRPCPAMSRGCPAGVPRGGRPPSWPLVLAAAALAGLVLPLPARPPRRPRATAWGLEEGVIIRAFRYVAACVPISASPFSPIVFWVRWNRGNTTLVLSTQYGFTVVDSRSTPCNTPRRFGRTRCTRHNKRRG